MEPLKIGLTKHSDVRYLSPHCRKLKREREREREKKREGNGIKTIDYLGM